MRVKIRLSRGRHVARNRVRNGRAARIAASLLTLSAICLGSFGAWRLAEDLGWAGDFIISEGLLSHWQVWIAAAAALQWAAWRLVVYARAGGSTDSGLAT